MRLDEPKVSVVVPIYNVEDYLKQCVTSILQQTHRNIEVILVDDGSTDASPSIVDSFASADRRVKAVHQPNAGSGSARNTGIAAASGEWIFFVDADDFWEGSDCIERCLLAVEGQPAADVLIFDALLYYENPERLEFRDTRWDPDAVGGISNQAMLRYMIEHNDVRPSACTKMVRRTFLLDHDLLFKQGLKTDDIEWFLRFICAPGRYSYLPLDFYRYRQNRLGSTTHSIGRRNVCDLMASLEPLAEVGREPRNRFEADLLAYGCYIYTMALAFLPRLTKTERSEVWSALQEWAFLLRFGQYRSNRAVRSVSRVVGVRGTAWLMHFFLMARDRRRRSQDA